MGLQQPGSPGLATCTSSVCDVHPHVEMNVSSNDRAHAYMQLSKAAKQGIAHGLAAALSAEPPHLLCVMRIYMK